MPDTDFPTTRNEACTHKADHWHGTLSCYSTDDCRCDDCRRASRDYTKALRIARGDQSPADDEDPEIPALAAALFAAEWTDQAACTGSDPDLFFPERGASTQKAKAICAECPVQAECLDYAVEAGEKFGIWGGMSERDRRKVRKQRREEAA